MDDSKAVLVSKWVNTAQDAKETAKERATVDVEEANVILANVKILTANAVKRGKVLIHF
ncbi:hypothetical protein BEWA_036220 [Theileria equi strain WA]|uniref:Uncharacterized protein n=1 Tax=Theileria equi strain WA TaxID=1537102 RepID=L1LE12_THEEQ|nr:hypothetical protein BEWA_036220 [Theileria equi strain WA]EKX73586.1 hypothetical protein BEWA_036220 [Theileria equi strain WA]|eukprot:XP_004833038.1 hypothetical protein BEWA_036220 [Theileria equi strain WA]